MKRRYHIRVVAIAVAGLTAASMSGCRSLPAPHYYSLAAVSPATVTARPVLPVPLRVRHISLPHEMDHLGLTHHLGPTQLAISDTDQWTAPLNTLIQGTITRDLGERFGFEQVLAADALPVTGQATLDLDFVALAADETCAISGQVNWTVSSPNGAPHRGSVRLMAPATGCPDGLPTALSTALGDLADQLAQHLPAP